MVGKLIKHEARLQGWPMFSVLAAQVVVFLLAFLTWVFPFGGVTMVWSVFAIMVLFGLYVAVGILLLINYYRSMYGRSGYFTMSLPVSGAKIYAVKVLWAFVVWLFSIVLALLGTLFYGLGMGRAATEGNPAVPQSVPGIIRLAYSDPVSVEILQSVTGFMLLLVVAGTALSVFEWAFVITFGNTPLMLRLGKAGGMIVAFIINYVVVTVLSVVVTFLIPLQFKVGDETEIYAGNVYAGTNVVHGDWGWVFTSPIESIVNGDTNVIPMGSLVVYPLCMVAYILVTIWMINRHTSLR